MSQLNDLQQDIGSSWRYIQGEWMTAREHWRDAVAVKFEREYWNDLESEIPALISAMSEMDEAIQQAIVVLEE